MAVARRLLSVMVALLQSGKAYRLADYGHGGEPRRPAKPTLERFCRARPVDVTTRRTTPTVTRAATPSDRDLEWWRPSNFVSWRRS